MNYRQIAMNIASIEASIAMAYYRRIHWTHVKIQLHPVNRPSPVHRKQQPLHIETHIAGLNSEESLHNHQPTRAT